MSWWNAKYKNNHDEYEITFGSKYKEKTKIVEKVCKAIIDKLVQSEDDIAIVRYGRWIDEYGGKYANAKYVCSCCGKRAHSDDWKWELSDFCPNCGAKMEG